MRSALGVLDLNTSMVLGHLPVLEQPAAAAAAGFTGIELWWPFASPAAPPDGARALVAAVRRAGVSVEVLNLYGGDLAAGERGIASVPGRERDFATAVEAGLRLGGDLAVRVVNPMYGNRQPGADPRHQDDLAVENLTAAARRLAEVGAVLAVEPLSGVAAYPLRTAAATMAVVRAVRAAGGTGTGLLADLYHLSQGGEDVGEVADRWARDTVRVQLADAPGRGRPGTGELPLAAWVRRFRDAGYAGGVGLEHAAASPDEGFEWVAEQLGPPGPG